MKKLRFICFLMSIVFICTCFPLINSMASTIVLNDDDYLHSLEVLRKVCPDFPLEAGEVTTREEFVAAVVMVLNMPKAADAPIFFRDVDVENKYRSHIAYGAKLGLISNVDLFYPASPITYEQAIKIVMTAAGYTTKAELTGGYPIGYIKAAQQAGVGQNLNLSIGSVLTHSEAISLIFDACTADMMEQTLFGDSEDYSITAGKNIFSTYHSVYMAEGIVSANEHSGIRSINSASPEGTVTIDGVNYSSDGYGDYLGKNVRVFYKDTRTKDVICIYECGNKVYKYTSGDSLSLSGSVITVGPKDSKKDVKHTLGDYTVLYNGKCFITANPGNYINPSSGSVALIDNNSDGRIDVIEITKVEYGIIGSVNEIDEKIYDKFKRNGTYDLSDTKYTVKEDDGTVIDLSYLEEEDTVGFAFSKDGKKCEIIRYNQQKGGVFEATSGDKIIVSGEEYTLSDYYTSNVKQLSKIKLGGRVILTIGDGGSVIYVKEFDSDIRYGVFIAAGSMSGLGAETMVKLFSDDGKMHELPIAPKIKIDSITYTEQAAIPVLEAVEAKTTPLDRVVKYSLNSDGKINILYTSKRNQDGSKVFLTRCEDEAQPVLYDDNTNQGYLGQNPVDAGMLVFKNDVFYPHFAMSPECVIIKAPKSDSEKFDEKYYSVASATELKDYAASHGDAVEGYGYDVDMEGASLILWLTDEGGSAGVAKETANAFVENVTKGINLNGEECYVVRLFADGKAEKYYSIAGTASENTVKQMKPGDIVQVSYNRDREITGADINFVWNTKEIKGNAQASQGYNGRQTELSAGYLYNFYGKMGMIVRNKTIDQIAITPDLFGNTQVGDEIYTDMYPVNLGRGKVYFVKFNYERGSQTIRDAVVYTESDTSSVESFYTSGKDADYVVQRGRFHDIYYSFIYVN